MAEIKVGKKSDKNFRSMNPDKNSSIYEKKIYLTQQQNRISVFVPYLNSYILLNSSIMNLCVQ